MDEAVDRSDGHGFIREDAVPSANMPFKRERDFRVGNGIFRKIWVSAPSSTTSSDGLGPLFNARLPALSLEGWPRPAAGC